MIVFDLDCRGCGQRCESWFRSNCDFEEQRSGGLLACPTCGSAELAKAPMAPSVARKGSQSPVATLARLQEDMLRESRWVGDKFVETARAIHSGESEVERVHGQATLGEARDLIADGVPVCPLPLPVVPPSQVN